MKKLIILLLTAVMIFSVCACQTEETPEEIQEEEIIRDMGGAVLNFFTRWGDNFDQEPGFSEIGDLQIEQYANLKEKYNFDFVVTNYTEDTSTLVMRAVSVSEGVPDMLDSEPTNAYKLFKQDLLAPLDEVETIDLSSTRWGPATFRRYGVFKSRPYGVYYYDWEDPPHIAGIIMFNNELMKEMGSEVSPYEMQEQKKWNWDSFKELISSYTVTFNDAPVMGLGVIDINYFAKTAVFSNGGEVAALQDGRYICGYRSPEALAGLDYAASLYKEGYAKDMALDTFVNKQNVFLFSESWQGTVMSETAKAQNRPIYSMDDYGFLPFPAGPSAPENNYSSFTHSTRRLLWVLNCSENDANDIGFMMNLVFSPLPGSPPEAWKARAEAIIFHHKEGFENYVNMVENVKYDYSTELNDIQAKINAQLTAIVRGTKTPAAGIDTVIDSINTVLDTELNS